MLAESAFRIITANDLNDAATKVVAACRAAVAAKQGVLA
jgi:hypothetical protein